jgi:multidrug resistance efflux pump
MRTLARGFAAASLAALALILAACGGSPTRAGSGGSAASFRDSVVRRGEFRGRFLLTGELDAVRAESLVAPRTPQWTVTIRWMEADGATVAGGQKVVEFDNSAFSGDLEEKRLALVQAESDLERTTADVRTQIKDREFTVEQRQIALEKAEIDAAVPEELLDRRKHQERQLSLRRARMDYDKAKEDLDSYRASSRADLDNRRISLEKARREITTAEGSIEALTLLAPREGILVVGDHPWEDRKFQVGDTVFAGWTVMRIPDLAAMRVEAQLPDVDDGRIAVGMPAVSTLDTYPDLRFPGRVVELTPVAQEPVGQSLRRAFHVRIDLDRTDPDKMRPGMSVKVEVETGRLSGVLLAPRGTLDRTSSPAKAFLAGGGSADVRVGPCNGSECVIESGLAEGTRLRERA